MDGVKNLFSVPIFETQVDITQVVLPESYYEYNSEVNWSFGKQECPEQTYDYLHSLISPFLLRYDPYINCTFTNIWRNKYEEKDYQGYHIHAQSQWSYIIYETVDSKTVLYNPAWMLIQNHMPGTKLFPVCYNTELKAGSMIVFPSWIAHHVKHGNVGTTISGNILLEYDTAHLQLHEQFQDQHQFH